MQGKERWPGEVLKARHDDYIDKLESLIQSANKDKEQNGTISNETIFSTIDLIGGIPGIDFIRFTDDEREILTILSIGAFVGLGKVKYSEFMKKYPVDVLGLPLVVDFKGSDLINIESDFIDNYPNELIMKYLNISNSLRSGVSANQIICNMVEVDYKTGKSNPYYEEEI